MGLGRAPLENFPGCTPKEVYKAYLEELPMEVSLNGAYLEELPMEVSLNGAYLEELHKAPANEAS